MKALVLAALLSFASFTAFAAPITYTPLGTDPVLGAHPGGVNNDPNAAQYYSFYSLGGAVTVTGSRIDAGYDMAFWLFSGLFADTTDFGPSFDAGDAGFIGFHDDEIPHAGPFGDPFFNGVLAAGWYTVAVVNFLSDGNTGNDQVYDYSLSATGVQAVPEPLSLALLGLGLAGVAATRRRS